VSAVPRLTTPVKIAVAIAVAIVCAGAPAADAQAPSPETGPEQALTQKIAVWRFDALGIEPELVARLETLFRMELDRLAKQPMPSRREVERAVTVDQRECTGEEKCLGAIGKKLGVDVVVTGTVGALGDSYVLNIKAVEAATSKQLTRIQSDPLRGSPDDLIEGVRVAAYKLLAPDQLHGTVQIQSDLVGAEVKLDDRTIGKTPLPQLGVVGKLPLGKHRLRVQARGYAPFEEDVEVRFQKVSQVVVRLLPSDQVLGTGKLATVERRPFYTKTWFIVGVGVAAAAIGAYAGWRAGTVDCVRIVNGKPDQGGC
jgi:hypothetical protein